MGTNLCGCNNDTGQGNESNVSYINKYIFLKVQLGQNQPINTIYSNQFQNGTLSKNDFSQSINKMTPIEKITAKNQINKIIRAYRKYKRSYNQTYSQNTNENITTDIGQSGIEYIGSHDSKGNKKGFGIQKMRDGSRFSGIFSNDKANGWGIYEHKDGDIYRGQYKNDRTSGY